LCKIVSAVNHDQTVVAETTGERLGADQRTHGAHTVSASPARAPASASREQAAPAPADTQAPAPERAARLQRYLQTHPDMAERIERLRAPGMN
jgi:hypothetical protein